MEVKYHPIIFSAENVRATLEGRKTYARRVIKFPKRKGLGTDELMVYYPEDAWAGTTIFGKHVLWVPNRHPDDPDVDNPADFYGAYPISCPYGRVGDRLWVRESYMEIPCIDPTEDKLINYKADFQRNHSEWKWKPSIFMPRWASRITLEIVSIRAERLWNISADDVNAEGIEPFDMGARSEFDVIDEDGLVAFYSKIWDSLNAKLGHPWDNNDWVWVIEFKRIDK